MIDLTRLNGHRMVVNCDLIKLIEATPDTTLTLVTGEKLIVLEPIDDLVTRVKTWRSHILRMAWPDAAPSISARIAYEISHPDTTKH